MSFVKLTAVAFVTAMTLSGPVGATTIAEVLGAIDAKISYTNEELSRLWSGYKNLSGDDIRKLAEESAGLQALQAQLVSAKDSIENDPNVNVNKLITDLHLDVSPY